MRLSHAAAVVMLGTSRPSSSSGKRDGDSVKSINLGGGVRLTLSSFDLEIELRYCCGCFLSKKEYIAFGSIENVKLDWHCFSGALTLALQDGQQRVFTASKSKLISAASIIKRKMVASSSTARRVLPEDVKESLLHHDKVGIADFGIMVKNRMGMCRSSSMLIPWTSFVSLSMKNTCCGRQLELTTDSSSEVAKTVAASSSPTSEAHTEKGEEVVDFGHEMDSVIPEHTVSPQTISWSCSRSSAEETFRVCKYMMATNLPKENGEDTAEVHNYKISDAGLEMERAPTLFGCGGGVAKMFLPWTSVTGISWTPKSCCSQPFVSVSDVNGLETQIQAVGEQDFQDIVKTFGDNVETHDWDVSAELQKVQARKGLEIREDGLMVAKGHAKMFVPWARIDHARMQSSCFGGAANLFTNSGVSLTVAERGCCGGAHKILEVFQQVHALKYGVEEFPASEVRQINVDRAFNGMTSQLSDSSLRLVISEGWCQRLVREFDLERVVTCRVNHAAAGPELVLQTQVTNSMVEVIVLPLSKREACDSLVQDIMRRAQARKAARPKAPEGSRQVGEARLATEAAKQELPQTLREDTNKLLSQLQQRTNQTQVPSSDPAAPPSPAKEEEEKPPEPKVICVECGTPFNPGQIYCRRCGAQKPE